MGPVTVFADEGTKCGEAPLWDATAQQLLWVDNEQSLIFVRGLADRQTTVLCRDYPAFALAANDDGRLVMAGSAGIALRSPEGAIGVVLANPAGGDWCFNDAVASAVGGLYAGTFHWGANGMERTGNLCHISVTGSAEIMDDGIRLANGLSLSPDDRTLYFADSMARTIYAYDVLADGQLTRRRVFATLSRDDGLPDGLTVDAAGFVWCACWYGGQLLRLDPDGAIEQRIPMPAKQVSSMAFGGPQLRDLYVTSAVDYWPSEDEPSGFDRTALMGGAVYKSAAGVTGKADHKCRFRV